MYSEHEKLYSLQQAVEAAHPAGKDVQRAGEVVQRAWKAVHCTERRSGWEAVPVYSDQNEMFRELIEVGYRVRCCTVYSVKEAGELDKWEGQAVLRTAEAVQLEDEVGTSEQVRLDVTFSRIYICELSAKVLQNKVHNFVKVFNYFAKNLVIISALLL